MKKFIKKWWTKLKTKSSLLKLSLIPFVCGLLYAIAGSEHTPKQIRRFGIPALLTFFVWLFLQNVWVLTMLSQIGVYSIGHGIPDNFEGGDEGSALGRFWYSFWSKLLK